MLIMSIPNIDSFQARLSGEKWFHLDIPYHLYHYSAKGMRNFLKKMRFKVQKINHFSLEFNPFGMLQSLLNVSGFEFNHLYSIFRPNFRKRVVGGRRLFPQTMFMLILTLLISPVSIIASTFSSAVGRGGTIEIYAQKEKT